MIKTLKNTIKEMYYWIKGKVSRFKKWLVILILGAVVVAAPLVLPPNVPDIALEKIQAKYEASELKDKYRLEKTAFILDAVDENAIQSEVGNKNLDKFTPELTLRKWDDEVNFKVKYKHNEQKKDQKVDIENKKIKWKGKKVEVHYYDIKKGELLHDKVLESDVYEVEVILLEKPDTNIVEFDIETTGLAFYYQPELTQEEIDDGAFRPENVIGSYAVYHESKANQILYPFKKGELTLDELNQKVLSNELVAKIDKKTLDIEYFTPGKNYRAGKAFHIYRPKIIDSAGTEIWGELNITSINDTGYDTGLLTVEIPQEFLDNAVYPIRHAAGLTFGYESTGGTGQLIADRITGSQFTGAAGTGTSISFCKYSDFTEPWKAGIYLHSDLSLVGTTTVNTTNTSTDTWVTESFEESINLTAGVDYVLVVWANQTSPTQPWTRYDDGVGTTQGHYQSIDYSDNSGSFPATMTATHEDRKYSIYCTYEAGGAAERRMFLIE